MPSRFDPPSYALLASIRVRGRFTLFLATTALVLVLWPALTGDAILGYRDALHNYGPMRELFWSGRVSFWNDRAFGGSSVLADIVQQPFYLGNLVMRALHAPAWPGIPIQLLLHILAGMLATWALLRRAVQDDAAALGAAVFGLCGFSLSNLTNVHWACAACWVPAALFAFDLWAEQGGAMRMAFLALALPQILLAGDPLLCALTGVSGVGVVWLRRKRPLSRLLWEGAAIAVGMAAIVSPQVISSARGLGSITRGAGLPREVREQWSLHPIRVAELFVPRMFGPLFSDGFWGGFTVSPPWTRNWVHSIYAGAISPALVAAALCRRRREAAPWVLVAAFALVLSLGSYFFHLYGAIGDMLPLFRFFRYPQRLVALFMPAWAMLMALGAAELARLPRGQRVALAAGAALLSATALGAATLLAWPDSAAVWRSLSQIALVGAASCAALLLPPRFAVTALAAVLVVDLVAANAELSSILPRDRLAGSPAACDALDRASGHARPTDFRVYVDQETLEPGRDADWIAQRVREYNFGKRNLTEVCGFRESAALTSLDPVEETRLWREVSPLRMLAALGTRFVVTRPGQAARFGGREVSVDPLWGFAVVEVPTAAPMLFRPARVEQIAASRLTELARARPELLGAEVAALDAAPREHLPDPSARLVSWSNLGDQIFFRVRQREPGYWVLNAKLDGGWKADIEGAPAGIVPSDLVRRAIWVPPGDHLVSLRYQPRLELLLFALSAVLTLWLAALAAGGLLRDSARRRARD